MIPITEQNIQAALSYVSSDIDHLDWMKIGAAIKDTAINNGFELFDTWSQNGASYNKAAAMTTWKAIKTGGAVTVGTLFGLASQNGWKPEEDDYYQETEAERIARENQRKAKEAVADKQRESKAKEAIAKTSTLLNSATLALANHPYLVRKGIKPVKTLMELPATIAAEILGYQPKSDGIPLTGRLLIAKVRIKGEVSTAELIDEHGKKSAIAGGAKSGGYYALRPVPLTDAGDTFLIGEGVATIVSAFEATGHHSIAALSASNLPKVAKDFREKYPSANIIILADSGNGQKYAEQAAKDINGKLALPVFTDEQLNQFTKEHGKAPTDFNDLHCVAGKSETAKQINSFFQQSKVTAPTAPTNTNSTQSPVEQHENSIKDQEIPVGDFVYKYFTEKNEEKFKLKVESRAAKILAEALSNKNFAYNNTATNWHKYTGYCWTPLLLATEPENEIMHLLYEGTNPLGFKMGYFSGVTQIVLRANLLPLPPEPIGKIPFANGLLDMTTKTLEPIGKHNAATWAIPHDYDPQATCSAFIKWLNIAVADDQETIQLLRAYINACLIGRADLQKFLMLIGAAGTGKSTLIRLLFAMLGENNCITTDLKSLETNQYETASIYGKRLTAVTDSSKYGGGVDVLKALTGQDPVRNEKKHIQQSGSYIYEGMVLIASNEPIASTDYTSGLDRRRLVVKFDHRIKPGEKETFMKMGGEEQLHREIPAIINWALQLSRDKVTSLFMNPPQKSKDAGFEALTAQNPIADWISTNLIPDETVNAFIGIKEESRGSNGVVIFENADTKLYPNYLRWCIQNGRDSLSVKRFKHTLIDMLQTMGWEDHKDKPRHAAGVYINGIRIRLDFEMEHDWQAIRGGI
ncbi:DNA primase, phage/plasmid [uncultured Caudovirales phage]|uniref:DNA primase, phage/plasmid n=1 Tax=uncultured Caudovirales phage TaxID=2100421 RepID=A0A6J5S3P5_9CAUD|nr:DNA primase [uncultured Caudovirales phage]CAB4202679.1 DNA primase, phage/plasmid [uncultured Caudovirales phage]